MISPHGIDPWFLQVLLKVLHFENIGLKDGNVFLNGLQAYKRCCDTSNFTVYKFKQLLGSQYLLWKGLLKYSTANITSKKTWKSMQKSLLKVTKTNYAKFCCYEFS